MKHEEFPDRVLQEANELWNLYYCFQKKTDMT
jgi:hypothetical protein